MNTRTLIVCAIAGLLLQTPLAAQGDLTYDPSPFTWNGTVSASLAQVSFRNWAAGGDYSYLVGLNSTISPQWNDSVWSASAYWYGVFSVFKKRNIPFQKVQDNLELSGKAGRSLGSGFHAVIFFDLSSQLWPGYDEYSGSNAYISNFMAPGYLTNGIGVDMRSSDQTFSLVVTPLATKQSFVLDKGVDPTFYGVAAGKKVMSEAGAYAKITYNGPVFGSLSFKGRAIGFADFTRSVNPDVSFIAEVDYHLASWFKVYASLEGINDDDMSVNLYEDLDGDGQEDDFAGVGPRLQLYTQFGCAVGISF